MKTNKFTALIDAMSSMQKEALIKLEEDHPDLIWDGGKINTRPLRVSIKNSSGRNISAINTREKDAFLRLEFRSKDYNGTHSFFTQHKNFDKAYDIVRLSDINIASEILNSVKTNYA